MSRQAVDITTAPNYDDGCVWVRIGGMKRTCIEPEVARQMADEIESEANQMKADANGQGSEHEELIADLRRFADEVKSGEMGGGDE